MTFFVLQREYDNVFALPAACNEKSEGRLCDKHNLEYLKYLAETAQNDYIEELKKQSRKGTETEREQDAKLRQAQKHEIHPEK